MGIFILGSCHSSENPNTTEQPASQDSLTLLGEMVKNQPDNDLALLERARYFYRQNSYDAALNDLERALLIDSTRLTTFLLKSKVEMDYFRSLESLRTLEKAEKIWPQSFLVKENLAQTHLILKQYLTAEQKATEALEINPGAARPYLYLGMIAKEQKDTTLALDYLHRAVQNDADLLDAWVELARTQMDINAAEAAPYFKSALQIAPEDILIWHAYGMFWQQQDSLEQAKKAYDYIISLDPGYHEAYFNHALILMDQDSFEVAVPHWDEFIKQRSESARGFYYRGICFELTEHYSAAYEDYLMAKNLDPGLPQIDRAIQTIQSKLDDAGG